MKYFPFIQHFREKRERERERERKREREDFIQICDIVGKNSQFKDQYSFCIQQFLHEWY